MNAESKRLSNVGFRGRFKQMIILAIAILVGVIISVAAGAQDFHRAKKRHFRSKYREQIGMDKSACKLLSEKRNTRPRVPLFASWHRKPKPKPQAEVDTPLAARTPKFRRPSPILSAND